jgi:hypothetical protein
MHLVPNAASSPPVKRRFVIPAALPALYSTAQSDAETLAQNIGAGEGNRTLVISLEGIRIPKALLGRSDNPLAFCALDAKGNFPLSERRRQVRGLK